MSISEVDVRLEIESGDVVVVECAEPIGQVTPTWTDDDFAGADPSLAIPIGMRHCVVEVVFCHRCPS